MESPTQPVVRVSILRCPSDKFAEMRQMMNDLGTLLRPGTEAMRRLVVFYVGDDEAASSLSSVSLWTDLDTAKQLDTFCPILDPAKPFLDKGGTFERPIMNYLSMWELKSMARV